MTRRCRNIITRSILTRRYNMAIENKVAIVTGAGQGIGYEIARLLVERGVQVVLNDSDETLARQAAQRVGCHALPGDASDVGFIGRLVQEAVSRFGRLDIVIANAGITLFGDFLSYTPEAFDRVMRLNLGGSFFLAQTAARQMRQQGEGGRILFTSSVTGH